MLVRVVERLRLSQNLDEILVATTVDHSDDATEVLCRERGYPYLRGSTYDVLDRYYQTARQYEAEVIVRITADCPLIDPWLVDEAITIFLGELQTNAGVVKESSYDFVANRLPPPWGRSYPIGLDTEVCTFGGLERAWKEASEPHQREHVMPFFYEGIPAEALHPSAEYTEDVDVAQATSPRGFHVGLIHHHPDYGSQRWTVDTPEDFEFISNLYEYLGGRQDFSWQDILEIVKNKPALTTLNRDVDHKDYRSIDAHWKKEGH